MQSQSWNITCPIHPSENIQRVNLDYFTSKNLYCLECVLKNQGIGASNLQLKSIQDFVSFASAFYEQSKGNVRPLSEGVNPFASKIAEQGEEKVRFTERIASEKKKTEQFFDQLKSELMSFLEEKKLDCLHILDKQYNNFIHWHQYCEKQFMKAYPNLEDMPALFPSREKLENRLSHFSKFEELDAFVRTIKEDLYEDSIKNKSGENSVGNKNEELNGLAQKLDQIRARRPSFNIENINLDQIIATMKKSLSSLLDKSLMIKDLITNISQTRISINSQIINPKDYQLVKGWLPERYQDLYPELLYSSNRDGKESKTFHERCDEKGPTVTFIKCKVEGDSEERILGGFLDKDWDSNEQPIKSEEAFIFSVTAGIKSPVLPNAKSAAYGNPISGPQFGMDLIVRNHLGDSDVFQVSYQNSSRLYESQNSNSTNEKALNLGGGLPGQFPLIPPPMNIISGQAPHFPLPNTGLSASIGQIQPRPINFAMPPPNDFIKWAKDNKGLPGQLPNVQMPQMPQIPVHPMMLTKKSLHVSEVEVFALKLL